MPPPATSATSASSRRGSPPRRARTRSRSRSPTRRLELLGDDDPSNRGQAWWAIAEAEANEGRIDAANDAFARAADELDEQSHVRERIELHSTWGRVLRKAGREPEALDVLERAADLAVQAGHADVRSER